MGGSSSSGDRVKTTRYAPYIEAQHSSFLSITATKRESIINDSPFADYSHVDIDESFLGLCYLISSLPSLYEVFGRSMVGLDINSPWSATFEKLVGNANVDASVLNDMELVDDEIVKGELANFQVSMRNLNAVTSSSFVVGKSVIEDKRLKLLTNISLEAKVRLLDSVGKEYIAYLNWEKAETTTYAKFMKDYFMLTDFTDNVNADFDSRDSLWPFTLFSFEGYALGTMRGVVSWRKQMSKRERSSLSTGLSIASYTATGAYIGAEIGSAYPGVGNVVGGVIGGVVGFVVGVAVRLFE